MHGARACARTHIQDFTRLDLIGIGLVLGLRVEMTSLEVSSQDVRHQQFRV
jgi:hypothetical protein